MKSKGLLTGAILCISGVLFVGCGSQIPDMTEEQRQLVTEYAADVLVKNNIFTASRLLSDQEVEDELLRLQTEAIKKAEREAKKQQEEEQKRLEKEQKEQEKNASSESSISVAPQYASIQEFFGISDVSFQYAGFECVPSYPYDITEDLFFSMNATSGNQLLVMKFQVSSMTGSETTLNMISYEARYQAMVNGERQNVLTTMLLDDLQSYNGNVPAEGVALVLICEIPENTAGQISSLSLILRDSEKSCEFALP